MAFVVPVFPLSINIWRNAAGFPPAGPPALTTVCNLAPGRRVITNDLDVSVMVWVLLPAGTDIRSGICGAGDDYIEIPAGSGRFYKVRWVDDIGKGFSNEHRIAGVQAGAPWPAPIP